MTLRENAAVLETYLHNIRNIEEMPPGPVELDALDPKIGRKNQEPAENEVPGNTGERE